MSVHVWFSGGIDYDQSREDRKNPFIFLLQADAQYRISEGEYTPRTKFRGSTPCTGQTWRSWISPLVRQRHANYALMGAPPAPSRTKKQKNKKTKKRKREQANSTHTHTHTRTHAHPSTHACTHFRLYTKFRNTSHLHHFGTTLMQRNKEQTNTPMDGHKHHVRQN